MARCKNRALKIMSVIRVTGRGAGTSQTELMAQLLLCKMAFVPFQDS
jgi:hypothetical protein